jgi:hypothetical protein
MTSFLQSYLGAIVFVLCLVLLMIANSWGYRRNGSSSGSSGDYGGYDGGGYYGGGCDGGGGDGGGGDGGD